MLPTNQFDIGKVWVPEMHFCACPIHCTVHWRVGRRLGSCRLISVPPLKGSTIRAFSMSSTLWVLEDRFVYIDTVSIKPTTTRVMVDCCLSKLFNVISDVPQCSVLDLLFFLLHTSEPFQLCKIS